VPLRGAPKSLKRGREEGGREGEEGRSGWGRGRAGVKGK